MNKEERIESLKRLVATNNKRIEYAKRRLAENCHNPHLKEMGIKHLEEENRKFKEELNLLKAL